MEAVGLIVVAAASLGGILWYRARSFAQSSNGILWQTAGDLNQVGVNGQTAATRIEKYFELQESSKLIDDVNSATALYRAQRDSTARNPVKNFTGIDLKLQLNTVTDTSRKQAVKTDLLKASQSSNPNVSVPASQTLSRLFPSYTLPNTMRSLISRERADSIPTSSLH